MAFGEYYKADENYNTSNFIAGEWDCVITSCEEKISQGGNEMVVLKLNIQRQGELKYWLVDDKSSDDAWRRTNQNLTRFFDCFRIQRNNFDIHSWVGAKGRIAIDKGEPNDKGQQYFEVKRLIVERQSNPQQSQSQNGYTNNYGHQNRNYQSAQQQNYPPNNALQDYQRQQQPNYNQNNSGRKSAWVPKERRQAPQQDKYIEQEELDNIPF